MIILAVNRVDGFLGMERQKPGERMREEGRERLRDRWWVMPGRGFLLYEELSFFDRPPLLMCWSDDSYRENEKKKLERKEIGNREREVVSQCSMLENMKALERQRRESCRFFFVRILFSFIFS